uniref:Uncharacterized protein n=1 Tax=Phaffia rhodozyma TaxID=264483 RepID=Q9HFD3_PHARH|nr:hypothetical protein [Phaffia rhodozyma]
MVRSWFLYQKIGGSIPPAEPLSPFVKPSPSLGVEEAPPRDSSPTTLDKKNPRRVGWGPGVVVAPSLCVAVAPVRFRGSPTDERVAGWRPPESNRGLQPRKSGVPLRGCPLSFSLPCWVVRFRDRDPFSRPLF